MSHEYPIPHSRGHNVEYLDPDLVANECDDQLPGISTIGRGPRGEGLYAETIEGESLFKIQLKGTDFDEVMGTSPNLHAGKLSIIKDYEPLVPGAVSHFKVRLERDIDVDEYVLSIPPGIPGARLYGFSTVLSKTVDDIYYIPKNALIHEGQSGWESMPEPRVGDVVFFVVKELGTGYRSTDTAMYAGYINGFYGDSVVVLGHFVWISNTDMIVQERNERIAADEALGQRIDYEETARIYADNALAESINEEKNDRQVADQNLTQAINDAKAESVARDHTLHAEDVRIWRAIGELRTDLATTITPDEILEMVDELGIAESIAYDNGVLFKSEDGKVLVF